MATFTYEQLAQRLDALAIDLSPDYLHGVMAGFACAGIAPPSGTWHHELTGCLPDIDITTHQALLEALQALCERALGTGDFDFQPLLPDGDEFLSLRTEALARWCDGFVQAFLGGQKKLDSEDRETIDDLYAISQLQPDEDSNNPSLAHENESDFSDLCEYVRMAVLSLYTPPATAPAGDNA